MDKLRFKYDENQTFNAKVIQKNINIIQITFEDEIPSDNILTSGFDILNEFTDEIMSGTYYFTNYSVDIDKL